MSAGLPLLLVLLLLALLALVVLGLVGLVALLGLGCSLLGLHFLLLGLDAELFVDACLKEVLLKDFHQFPNVHKKSLKINLKVESSILV